MAEQQKPISGIKPPSALNMETNLSENWKLFKQKWENYAVLVKLNQQERAYQVALLLHALGDNAFKVYNGFTFATPEANRTTAEIIATFDTFAVGQTNESYERFVYERSRAQLEGESFESFHAAVCGLVRTCNYCQECEGSIVRDRIVLGITNKQTQAELLRTPALTLQKSIETCKAAESVQAQSKTINPEKISYIAGRGHKKKDTKICKFCSKPHEFKKDKCPAWGKKCQDCGQMNHFAQSTACMGGTKKETKKKHPKKKPVHQVMEENETESEAEWVNSVNSSKDIRCKMIMVETKNMVTFQVDTGASVNLLPRSMAPRVDEPKQQKLKMWNDSELCSVGLCRTILWNPKNNKKYSVNFVVVEEDLMPLLGYRASEQMALITVRDDNLLRVHAASPMLSNQEVFENDIGLLPGKHHLKTDETIQPTVMANHRIPISLRPALKKELDRLTDLGVLMPMTEPTPWVSQMVIVQKPNGGLRLCIDPRELNRALLR